MGATAVRCTERPPVGERLGLSGNHARRRKSGLNGVADEDGMFTLLTLVISVRTRFTGLLMRGARSVGRVLFALAVCLALPAVALAQITVNYNFDNSSGFYSTERQAAINAAGAYISTQFDGRGTISLDLNTQDLGYNNGGTLAFAGTGFSFSTGVASLTNGNAYRQATTGSGSNSFGTFNNSPNLPWYSGTSASVPGGQIDMQSVALHETTHSLGFLSFMKTNGTGAQNNMSGNPDTFSQLDSHLRSGASASDPRYVGSNGGYNTAIPTSQIDSGNNYFHGEFATAANGGAVRMSMGNAHINSANGPANAVMLPSIGSGQARRAYTNVDLAILIDMGWNQFVWQNSNGGFADNVSNANTNARWQNLDGDNALSPVGTITPNMVLRFGGNGGYTATNNLTLAATAATSGDANRFLLTRLILNGTAGTSTIAAGGSNVLRFDSTIGVAPQIRQDGAGAFNITHPLELTGRNLQLTGDGTGGVTLAGTIGQQSGQVGGIIKSGTSTFTLTGNNSYTGGTTINGGTLVVGTGGTLGTGAVNINSGGTLGRTGTTALATGSVTVASGGTLTANVAANGTASQLDLGANTLDFKTGATLRLTGLAGFTNTANASYTLALLTDGANLKVDGTTVGDGNPLGTYVHGTGATGAVVIDTSGFTLATGDNFTLARSGNNLVLTFSPVPEPALVLTVGAAGLAAAGWLRRRKTRAAEPTTAA